MHRDRAQLSSKFVHAAHADRRDDLECDRGGSPKRGGGYSPSWSLSSALCLFLLIRDIMRVAYYLWSNIAWRRTVGWRR